MQILNFGNKRRNGRRFGGVVKRETTNRIVGYIQQAALNLELFGLALGAVISLFLLISLFIKGRILT
jgi:hypothetical protein